MNHVDNKYITTIEYKFDKYHHESLITFVIIINYKCNFDFSTRMITFVTLDFTK